MHRDGENDSKRGPRWHARAESIRKRDGYRCRRCGKSQAENKTKLSVDHIIPWRSFADPHEGEANDPANLVALCASCHSWKTTTAERAWLKGDMIGFKGYLRSLNISGAELQAATTGVLLVHEYPEAVKTVDFSAPDQLALLRMAEQALQG